MFMASDCHEEQEEYGTPWVNEACKYPKLNLRLFWILNTVIDDYIYFMYGIIYVHKKLTYCNDGIS